MDISHDSQSTDDIVPLPGSDVGPGGDATMTPSTKNEVVAGTKSLVMNEFQNLLHEVDEKRKADKKIISEFRSKMNAMLEQTFQQIEGKIQKSYDETNKQMKLKLDYLNESLDRVVGLEQELGKLKSAVGVLYHDIQPK